MSPEQGYQAGMVAVGVIIIAVSVFFIALALLAGIHGAGGPKIQTFSYFTAGGKTFRITGNEVDTAEWEHGLMNTTVTNSTFMLFDFGSYGIYDFWMKDTDYPLDMIWLNVTNDTGTVVYIAANATPCLEGACTVYDPGAEANYVLEAQAGFAARNNITAGSVLKLGN